MGLAAILVATPIFGFSLSVDPSLAAGPGLTAAPITAVASDEGGATESSGGGGSSTAELMQERGRLSKLHRALGIATWASMTVTVVLGYLQYYNLYGMFQGLGSTPCVEGRAVFGQNSCVRQPLPHLVSSMVTTALYSVTFGLSLRMPDPLNLSEGDSDYARNLRRHKRLRWVHLVGMIAQIGLGAVIANGDAFGLSRANDYRTLQALSTVHFGIGLMTYAALTWAGTIFLF
ncbi:MAG: hypothetical protein AAGE52_40500 [Myxococcota bacterium]